MAGFADINPVLQDVGEGPISEGNAAPIFGRVGVAAFGDNAEAAEFSDQFAEGFLFEITFEDRANGFGLDFVDDQLLVLGVVTERYRPAGPFTLAPGCRNLVPDPFRG